MSRLPIPGQDNGSWGDILNDFLAVEHNSNGTLKTSGSLATKADDTAVVHLTGSESVGGTKTFSAPPVVPTPTSSTHAATKAYVDSATTLDSDLAAIAALTPTDNDILQRKSGAWTNRTPAQVKTDLSLTKTDVGLGSVDNTSDLGKPISTLAQSALDGKTDKITLTAKGDLYVATAASTPTRLAVGNNAQQLIADSSTSTGLAWTNPLMASVKDYNVTNIGLTAAITAAVAAGATHVFIPTGTYNETTTYSIPTGVKISGEGYGTNIVRSTSGNIFEIVGTSGTHKVHAEVSNLRFSGPSTQASSVAGAAVYFDYADECRVLNCWVSGFGLTNTNDGGIAGQRSTYLLIEGNHCTLNSNGIIHGTPTAGQPLGFDHSTISNNLCYANWEDGLHSQQGSFNTYVGNVGHNNGAVNSGGGIDLIGSTNEIIIGNIFHSNGGNGIEIGGPVVDSGHVLSNNVCYSNLANGISCANKTTRCTISGNICFSNTSHGISVSPSGTTSATQELMSITGNDCHSNGSSGINLSNTSSGSVVQFCVISANTCATNTSHGILLTGNVVNNRVADNICRSNTSNGIRLSSQTTNIPDANIIENNTVSGNGTQIGESGDTTTILRANKGFNPQGIAAITVTTSPFTYTAGFTPEVVYISGGTVSAITKSATTLFTSTNASVTLDPSEAVVITYSVAPTMSKDRR